MKKFIAVMTAAAMLTSLSACGASASTASSAAESTASSAAADSTTGSAADATTYKVAIVQQLDHASLDEIRTAIEAELDAKAAEKGITIEYKDFNGQNDATTLNQIGTQVVSDGYDAVIPIATLAAQCMATACESTKTPVIYAAISDPAAADLTDIDYVTGTSDALNTQSITKNQNGVLLSSLSFRAAATMIPPVSVSSSSPLGSFPVTATVAVESRSNKLSIDTLASYLTPCIPAVSAPP